MAVETPMMQGRSSLAFSLPSRQLYVIHGSRRRRYTERHGNMPSQAVELYRLCNYERV